MEIPQILHAGRRGWVGLEPRFLYFFTAYFALTVCLLLNTSKSSDNAIVARLQVGENGSIALSAHNNLGLIGQVGFGTCFRRNSLPVAWDREILAADTSHFRLQSHLLGLEFLSKVFGFHLWMIADFYGCAREVPSRPIISVNEAALRAMTSVV